MTFKFEDTKPDITNEELVADIKAVATRLNTDHLAQSSYRQHGRCSTTVIKKRFGTWNDAVAAAGFTVRNRREVPAAELFENLMTVWIALGRQPRK